MLNAYIVKFKLIVNDRLRYVSPVKIELLTNEEVKQKEMTKQGGDTFDSLWEFLQHRYYCATNLWKSSITKKRKIEFQVGESVKENMSVKWEYGISIQPYNNISANILLTLSADKVIQYCAERGFSVIIPSEKR